MISQESKAAFLKAQVTAAIQTNNPGPFGQIDPNIEGYQSSFQQLSRSMAVP